MEALARKLKSGLSNRCSVAKLRTDLLVLTDKSPVIYMWWFKADAVAEILPRIGEDAKNEKIMHDTIDGADYLALYVGKGKSCRERFCWHIRQHHDARTIRHGFLSTLRQTICGLLGINAVDNEVPVNDFIDRNCVLDWSCYPNDTPAQLGKRESEHILSGYFPLNIQGNPNVPKEIKRTLRKRRRDARAGRFVDSNDGISGSPIAHRS